MDFMGKFEEAGGNLLSADLLQYGRNELYYMRFEQIRKFWDRAESGGEKEFPAGGTGAGMVYGAEKRMLCSVSGLYPEGFGSQGLTDRH